MPLRLRSAGVGVSYIISSSQLELALQNAKRAQKQAKLTGLALSRALGEEGVGSLVALGVEGPAKGGLALAGEVANIAESIASNQSVSDLTSWNARSAYLISLQQLLTIRITMVGCRKATVRKRITCFKWREAGVQAISRPDTASTTRTKLTPRLKRQIRS